MPTDPNPHYLAPFTTPARSPLLNQHHQIYQDPFKSPQHTRSFLTFTPSLSTFTPFSPISNRFAPRQPVGGASSSSQEQLNDDLKSAFRAASCSPSSSSRNGKGKEKMLDPVITVGDAVKEVAVQPEIKMRRKRCQKGGEMEPKPPKKRGRPLGAKNLHGTKKERKDAALARGETPDEFFGGQPKRPVGRPPKVKPQPETLTYDLSVDNPFTGRSLKIKRQRKSTPTPPPTSLTAALPPLPPLPLEPILEFPSTPYLDLNLNLNFDPYDPLLDYLDQREVFIKSEEEANDCHSFFNTLLTPLGEAERERLAFFYDDDKKGF